MKRTILTASLMIMISALGATSRAQDQPPQDDQQGPGAARVSLMQGQVSTQRGDSGEWVATTVNAPLVRGDKIATGAQSRAEVQLDYAHVLRLGPNTEVTIADLTTSRIQLQVASGLADLSVYKGAEAEEEADTPNMAVHPVSEGTYRIQVDSPSETSMTVRAGRAEVSTPQGSTQVDGDQIIYVHGTDNPEFRTGRAPGLDAWDQWNRERDRQIVDAKSWSHTNRYYTGTQDLDRYGHWTYVPNYDWCWTPYVDAGWVPYREGAWDWEPYWGWTWVSYEPWGWAPYHYGRWFWGGSSWCWWPGYSYWGPRPIWAPAYVSFLGFGFGGRNWGFGFGFGFNSIGWCPLGPFDHARPWWGGRNGYNVTNITNITNVTNINNINGGGNINFRQYGRGPGRGYVSNLQAAMSNINVRRAITTVPTNQFVTGRVPRNTSVVSPAVLRTADVIHGTLPAVPTRQALSPVNRPGQAPSVTRGTTGTKFFTRNPAPATPRMSFNQSQAQIQQMVQTHNPQTAGNNGMNANRPGAANMAAGGQQGMNQNSARPGQPGNFNANRSFTQNSPAAARPGTPQAGRLGQQPQPAASAGWRRFGQPAPGSVQRGNTTLNSPAQRPATPGATTNQRFQSRTAPTNSQGGWQRFGTTNAQPAQGNRQGFTNRSMPSSSAQGTRERWPSSVNMQGGQNNGTPQNNQARPAAPSQNQGGWQRFNSQPAPRSQGYSSPGYQSGWGRSSGGSSGGSYSRPPLELNRPIVRERPSYSQGYGGGSSRGWSSPSQSRSYSAPRGGGGGYSAPRGGGGGSYSAPRGGGGGSGGHSSGGSSGGSHNGGGGGGGGGGHRR